MGFHHIPKPPRIVALGGPVSAAIRAMRADEPASDWTRLQALRKAIADRIEADIALLDALDPFADEREADGGRYSLDAEGRICVQAVSSDDEPSFCGLGVERPTAGGDDREDGDDNGLADEDGWLEQRLRDQMVAA
ncbi:hypothetical protein OKC48_20740 [Methylorubrum extorquens]|uniref:hypothetical protein n=1 Tax=Methylorubrum extorquens TaxID=408 RepID=UPI002237C113|nr:hypothetical protein [Methylorubrum extorquens]UYW25675.1 hypothetical protein OKC48_20740 [Methylorubrum extorquens]